MGVISLENKKNKKKEPWRIVVFAVAVIYIIFMWVKKDIAEVYSSLPQEEILPLIITSVVVSVFKVAVIAGAVLLVKWIISRIKNRKNKQE